MAIAGSNSSESISSPDPSLPIWDVRPFVYAFWVERTRPPTALETAAAFNLSPPQAQSVYEQLHDRHAMFLDPNTRTIRIANPFSAVPTSFPVRVGARSYWANCAWDAFGIPAMLNSDAAITTHCSDSGEPLNYTVTAGRVQGDSAVAHFLLPFQNWYDDLVRT